jgi:hypothetical protein
MEFPIVAKCQDACQANVLASERYGIKERWTVASRTLRGLIVKIERRVSARSLP